MNARLQDTVGEEIVRIVDNSVRYKRASEIFADYRPGRFRLTAPANDRYLPQWLLSQMRAKEGDFAEDGRISILDVEVLQPGIVRLVGCWVEDRRAVVITQGALYLTSMDAEEALCIFGEGLRTTLVFTGSLDSAFFQFGKQVQGGTKDDW